MYSNYSPEITSTVHHDKNQIRQDINFENSQNNSKIQQVLNVYSRSTYYICTCFGVPPHLSQPAIYFIETRERPNVVARRYISNHCLTSIKKRSKIPLMSATIDSIMNLRQIERHRTIGGLQARLKIFVADTLAVGILLEAEFGSQHVLGFLSDELKVILRSSQAITFLSPRSKTVNNNVTTNEFDTIQLTASDTAIKIIKHIRLKPGSATPLLSSELHKIFYVLGQTLLKFTARFFLKTKLWK